MEKLQKQEQRDRRDLLAIGVVGFILACAYELHEYYTLLERKYVTRVLLLVFAIVVVVMLRRRRRRALALGFSAALLIAVLAWEAADFLRFGDAGWMRLLVVAVAVTVLLVIGARTWFSRAIGHRKSKGKNVEAPILPELSAEFPQEAEPLEDEAKAQHDVADARAPADDIEAEKLRSQKSMQMPERFYFLASSRFLNCFKSENDFHQLYSMVEWVMVTRDQTLFTVGDRSDDGMFVIAEGSLGVFAPGEREMHLLSEYRVGESVGEIELLFGSPRYFTCIATSHTSLIRISKAVFEGITKHRPEIVVSFIQTTLARQWRLANFVLEDFLNLPLPPGTPVGVPLSQPPLSPSRPAKSNASPSAAAQHQEHKSGENSPADRDEKAHLESLDKTPNRRSKTEQSRSQSEPGAEAHAQTPRSPQSAQPFGVPLCAPSSGPTLSRYITPKLEPFVPADDPWLTALQSPPDAVEPAAFAPNIVAVSAGDLLFEQGSYIHDRVYVLLRGKMVATVADDRGPTHTRELPPGSVIGALAYFADSHQQESVRAMSACSLACLTAREFDAKNEHVIRIAMLTAETLCPTLRQFTALGLKRELRRAGQVLFTFGSPASDVFVVASGRVRVSSRPQDLRARRGLSFRLSAPPRQIAAGEASADQLSFEVSRRECIGEAAFLSGLEKHQGSAVCVRDSELVRISRASFQALRAAYPHQVLQRFSQVMASRLGSMMAAGRAGIGMGGGLNSYGKHLASSRLSRFNSPAGCTTIALIPGSANVDLSHFALKLTTALSQHGRSLLLSSAVVERYMGAHSVASLDEYYQRSRVTSWLSELEELHKFLVFQADAQATPWTFCSVRTADCVLIVADAAAAPAVGKLERTLVWDKYDAKSKSRAATSFCVRELVLIHNDNTIIPQGTRAWLECRQLDTHHHVKKNSLSHHERLARHLAGKSVGLVLGGGGARGLAHLGLIKAMHEHNIPIDCIGGTSQGSFMAALHALWPTPQKDALLVLGQRTQEMAKRLGSMWELIRDATFPVMSYFQGKKFGEHISSLLGPQVQIEDLWIKYFCVTTNVTKADMSVQSSGTLWKAVRASMSILDYLPPMQMDSGDLHIDGGYTNNLPVDVMRETFQPRFVIGVDVENKEDEAMANVEHFGDSLSGWWLCGLRLWNMMPFTKKIRFPRYADIISSLLYINHNRTIRQLLDSRQLDLYVLPELGNTRLLDYHKMEQIAEIGYRFAKVKLTEFRLINSHLLPAQRLVHKSVMRERHAPERPQSTHIRYMRRRSTSSHEFQVPKLLIGLDQSLTAPLRVYGNGSVSAVNSPTANGPTATAAAAADAGAPIVSIPKPASAGVGAGAGAGVPSPPQPRSSPVSLSGSFVSIDSDRDSDSRSAFSDRRLSIGAVEHKRKPSSARASPSPFNRADSDVTVFAQQFAQPPPLSAFAMQQAHSMSAFNLGDLVYEHEEGRGGEHDEPAVEGHTVRSNSEGHLHTPQGASPDSPRTS